MVIYNKFKMNHSKLETARILGNIQACYINKSELVENLQTVEDFQKSLPVGAVFYEQSVVDTYLDNVRKSEDADLIAKAEKEVAAMEKKMVLDSKGVKKSVLVKVDGEEKEGEMEEEVEGEEKEDEEIEKNAKCK